ncbi:MAG: amidohydrolase family protein [Kiritimatiellia bacterium]
MQAKVIQNSSVVFPDRILKQDLWINPAGRVSSPMDLEASEVERIDGRGCFAYPGMIDVLTHGYGNHHYGDANPDAIRENSLALPAHGVTAFAPSIISQEKQTHLELLRQLSRSIESPGARVLGLHSEGPCLAQAGAHSLKNLILPSEKLAYELLEACNGTLAFLTLAPELEGADAFCRILSAEGVGLHVGHSRALAGDVAKWPDMGIQCATHLFNVPAPLPAAPGPGLSPVSLCDAILSQPGLACGVICDGIHVNPLHIRLLTQLPVDRLVLETDSMKGSGKPSGRSELYPGEWIEVRADGASRTADGHLAGSSLTSDRALRNLIKFTGISLSQASHATSLNPARLAGRDQDLGSLEIGKQADILLLDPEQLTVTAAWVGGKQVFAS